MRPAFNGFATLCRLFNGAEIVGFDRQEEQGKYRLAARRDGAEILALWRTAAARCRFRCRPASRPSTSKGEAMKTFPPGQPVTIGESTVYLVDA